MMAIIHNAVQVVATWLIPLCIAILLIAAVLKKVPVYETFVEGAKDGFYTAARIAPYLLAMFFAIHLFEGSGALHALLALLQASGQALRSP